ncbi:MAG: glycolate oxidase subunit GlcF, partial [Gammaproteobacteria bacterium]|nr:glycolate oxidase subunit GlcF [Gammaproteobacteria bacterium]
LQHGQQVRGKAEAILKKAGLKLVPFEESHLCCGSAGTYSILQKSMAGRLRDRKLDHILDQKPDVIATANIGCLLHLQSETDVPVKHWVELLV